MARRSSTPGAPGSETAAAPAAPASAMTGRFPLSVAWAAAWLVLVAVALYARPPAPPRRRNPLSGRGVGDVRWRRLSGASPQWRHVQPQATPSVLADQPGLGALRRCRMVGAGGGAALRPGQLVPVAASRPAPVAGPPRRRGAGAGRPYRQRLLGGHRDADAFRHAGLLFHPRRPARCRRRGAPRGRAGLARLAGLGGGRRGTRPGYSLEGSRWP